ncbi:MAG: hypothetical protein HYS18_14415 [Burkholderiales bacterium]|nr:hypothetical protein [Burkholderiales bacterium]
MVLQQLARVLEPLVRLLLKFGGTYPQLAELTKAVFVKVAQEELMAEGRRLTDSNLAITTGIHRKDIKRLRAEVKEEPLSGHERLPVSLASTVFTKWLTDPNYLGKNGQPQTLARFGDENSFESLVQSVSTDIHPRTILDELFRLGLIEVGDYQVRPLKTSFVPNPDVAHMLEFLGMNLHDHAAAAVHNLRGTSLPFLEQSVASDSLDPSTIGEMMDITRGEWRSVLKKIVPQLEAREVKNEVASEPSAKTAISRIRIGMYFYAEELETASSDGGSNLQIARGRS